MPQDRTIDGEQYADQQGRLRTSLLRGIRCCYESEVNATIALAAMYKLDAQLEWRDGVRYVILKEVSP